MKAILTLDGGLTEIIDLKPYIHPSAREKLEQLYKLHWWEFREEWVWTFEDTCALYFRARRHADIFGADPEQAPVLYAIECAIKDCMEDEFS